MSPDEDFTRDSISQIKSGDNLFTVSPRRLAPPPAHRKFRKDNFGQESIKRVASEVSLFWDTPGDPMSAEQPPSGSQKLNQQERNERELEEARKSRDPARIKAASEKKRKQAKLTAAKDRARSKKGTSESGPSTSLQQDRRQVLLSEAPSQPQDPEDGPSLLAAEQPTHDTSGLQDASMKKAKGKAAEKPAEKSPQDLAEELAREKEITKSLREENKTLQKNAQLLQQEKDANAKLQEEITTLEKDHNVLKRDLENVKKQLALSGESNEDLRRQETEQNETITKLNKELRVERDANKIKLASSESDEKTIGDLGEQVEQREAKIQELKQHFDNQEAVYQLTIKENDGISSALYDTQQKLNNAELRANMLELELNKMIGAKENNDRALKQLAEDFEANRRWEEERLAERQGEDDEFPEDNDVLNDLEQPTSEPGDSTDLESELLGLEGDSSSEGGSESDDTVPKSPPRSPRPDPVPSPKKSPATSKPLEVDTGKAAEKQRADEERAEKERVDKEAADKVAADKLAADKERADKEAADKKAADKKAADKKAADKKAADKKAADKKAADKKAADKKEDGAPEDDGPPSTASSPVSHISEGPALPPAKIPLVPNPNDDGPPSTASSPVSEIPEGPAVPPAKMPLAPNPNDDGPPSTASSPVSEISDGPSKPPAKMKPAWHIQKARVELWTQREEAARASREAYDAREAKRKAEELRLAGAGKCNKLHLSWWIVLLNALVFLYGWYMIGAARREKSRWMNANSITFDAVNDYRGSPTRQNPWQPWWQDIHDPDAVTRFVETFLVDPLLTFIDFFWAGQLQQGYGPDGWLLGLIPIGGNVWEQRLGSGLPFGPVGRRIDYVSRLVMAWVETKVGVDRRSFY